MLSLPIIFASCSPSLPVSLLPPPRTLRLLYLALEDPAAPSPLAQPLPPLPPPGPPAMFNPLHLRRQPRTRTATLIRDYELPEIIFSQSSTTSDGLCRCQPFGNTKNHAAVEVTRVPRVEPSMGRAYGGLTHVG